MSPAEFREGLTAAGLSQTTFAALLNVNSRAARVWASEEGKIPAYAAIILRMLAVKEISPEQIRHGAATPLWARQRKKGQ
jgi:DNA-binding transcriptional regulator YiaG